MITEIQTLLSALGYRPGAADGLAGNRTTQAIRAFEQAMQRPQTGRPSRELLDLLRVAANPEPTPPAPPAPAVAKPVGAGTGLQTTGSAPRQFSPALLKTRWKIVDSNGARIEVVFEYGGRIGEVDAPRFWSWKLQGDKIRIVYDDGLGGKIVRHGTLSEDSMVGQVDLPGGATRSWRGEKIPDGGAGSPFTPGPSGALPGPVPGPVPGPAPGTAGPLRGEAHG